MIEKEALTLSKPKYLPIDRLRNLKNIKGLRTPKVMRRLRLNLEIEALYKRILSLNFQIRALAQKEKVCAEESLASLDIELTASVE